MSVPVDILGPRSGEPEIPAATEPEVLSREARQSDLAGAYSGYGSYCPEGIPVETAIFAILGAFGVAFGVLYRAVTLITGGRRRRRREAGSGSGSGDPDRTAEIPLTPKTVWDEMSYKLADLFWWGK